MADTVRRRRGVPAVLRRGRVAAPMICAMGKGIRANRRRVTERLGERERLGVVEILRFVLSEAADGGKIRARFMAARVCKNCEKREFRVRQYEELLLSLFSCGKRAMARGWLGWAVWSAWPLSLFLILFWFLFYV